MARNAYKTVNILHGCAINRTTVNYKHCSQRLSTTGPLEFFKTAIMNLLFKTKKRNQRVRHVLETITEHTSFNSYSNRYDDNIIWHGSNFVQHTIIPSHSYQ